MLLFTPAAKAWRTFVDALAGPLVVMIGVLSVAAAQGDLIGPDTRLGGKQLLLAVIAAFVTALVAYLVNLRGLIATNTPVGRAVATTLEYLAAALATVVVADLTTEAFVQVGNQLVSVVLAAVGAGLSTFVRNTAENRGVIAVDSVNPAPPHG